ncbi:hypothetical protein ACFL0O_06870 [Thermodesulfobacteriota bacterium]
MKRILVVFFVCIMMAVVLPAAATETAEQTEANLAQIKAGLDQRGKDLETEWAALGQEKAELDRIAAGGTLRGSKKNQYVQRNTQYNERMMRYQEAKEKLARDIETYNAAVSQMSAAANEGPIVGGDTGAAPETDVQPETQQARPEASASAMSSEEMEATVSRLNQTREEMAEEYKALQQEKQQISAAREGAQATGEQMNQLNQKIKEFAGRRQEFNRAVNDFNALTGQNVQTLPEP